MYRGRLAPTPTGLLHLGHARTFWTAQQRARDQGGILIYRNEDLDPARCKPEFREAAIEDLRWLGLEWQGEPIDQSARLTHYRTAFEQLRDSGHLFPCIGVGLQANRLVLARLGHPIERSGKGRLLQLGRGAADTKQNSEG